MRNGDSPMLNDSERQLKPLINTYETFHTKFAQCVKRNEAQFIIFKLKQSYCLLSL